MFSRIVGTGSYLPAKVVTNQELEQRLDTYDEWIRTRTGIERRHIVAPGETTLDMAEHASRAAIEMAGWHPNDIELIIVGTCTPDLVFPNVGVMLQGRLGNVGGPAFSVEAACSGFVYALSLADKFIRSGEYRRALVVGSESLSRITDPNDRGTAILFGDGAGAVVIEASNDPGVILTRLQADGAHHGLLHCSGGISAGHALNGDFIEMAGSELFKVAVTSLGHIAEQTVAESGLPKSALDWLVPHQANMRIIQATARKLDLPMERVIVTVQDHGNTSSASVPLALDVGVRDGRIKRDELLLLVAFGAGCTMASALIRF